jgi:hypothetical protein
MESIHPIRNEGVLHRETRRAGAGLGRDLAQMLVDASKLTPAQVLQSGIILSGTPERRGAAAARRPARLASGCILMKWHYQARSLVMERHFNE